MTAVIMPAMMPGPIEKTTAKTTPTSAGMAVLLAKPTMAPVRKAAMASALPR